MNGISRFLLFVIFILISFSACFMNSKPPRLTTFDVSPASEDIKDLKWIKLAEDKKGDGKRENSADGKAFYYFYEKESDMLWFRLDLYNEIDTETPAVSVSFDTDADQKTGINWYGTNSDFTFEKMLSVGPIKKVDGKIIGYNGITNQEGVRAMDWINEKTNVVNLYLDKENNSYILSIKRKDIDKNLENFNVIGSVGKNAAWNDDIGETGFAKIELNLDQ